MIDIFNYKTQEQWDELIDDLIDKLSYIIPTDKESHDDLKNLSKEFDCLIHVDVEKHNALQFTYYYQVDFNVLNAKESKLKNQGILYIEIESGINNGTQVNNVSWDDSTKPHSRHIEVIKDIIIDEDYYKTPEERKAARAILEANKKAFFEHIRQDNYDNHFTGGNSKLKSSLPDIKTQYILEIIKVKPNFI